MDLKEVCRTCLQPSASMLSIFSSIQVPNLVYAAIPILDLLKFFTEISLSVNDGHPKNICSDCLEKALKSYTFKLKCKKSEVISKQLMNGWKSENKLIKTEAEDTEKSNNKQFEQTDLDEVFLVQEVKQEPEIEINQEEGIFNETDSDDKYFIFRDLRCWICAKVFTTENNLKSHMIIHSEESRFRCEVRLKKFRFQHHSNTHAQRDTIDGTVDVRNFKCIHLNEHRKNHIAGSCEICLQQFQYKHCLKIHGQVAHATGTTNKRKLKCTRCPKLFRRKIYHTDEKQFHCEVCPKKFRFKLSMMAHMQTMHDAGTETYAKFKCGACSKLFGRKISLNAHMAIHTGEKPFQCKLCPKNFRFKVSFTAHMKTAHAEGTIKREFKCSTCFKLFLHKCSLKAHMTIHTGEKPFQCEVCPNKFRLKADLTEHMKAAHYEGITNITKHKCTTCSKLFGRKHHLRDHMRLHSEEKQFQCEVCEQKFRYKRSMTAHMQTTHGDEATKNKNFKCGTCSKSFRRISSLNEHITIHTGEKPFRCEICPCDFRLNTNLTKHVLRVHGPKQ